jgi:hypothetical protein
MIYKVDDYIFKAPSKRKTAKYDAYDLSGNFIISFGALYPDGTPYEQYKDQIGHYSSKDHLDKKRRQAYYLRHGRDAKFQSAKWFSHTFLWT